MEATTPPVRSAPEDLATSKRGLKRGLQSRFRTVILMLDETIITETPPLYSAYGWPGEPIRVPIDCVQSEWLTCAHPIWSTFMDL